MEQVDADSVRGLIDTLDSRYPGTAARLCQPDGSLRPLINVFVDGTNTRNLHGMETPLRDGAEVHIIPAVAGGSSSRAATPFIEHASPPWRSPRGRRGADREVGRGGDHEAA